MTERRLSIAQMICRLQGGELRIAEQEARQTLHCSPIDARARTILAWAHFDRGDDAEAIRLLQQAIHDDRDCDAAYEVLALIYRSAGKSEKANVVHAAWSFATFRRQPDVAS